MGPGDPEDFRGIWINPVAKHAGEWYNVSILERKAASAAEKEEK